MNILLVEDDLNLVDALSRMLVARGFQVVCCADGIEALVMLRQRQFDAALLDLTLPGLDGLEVLQRLRDEGSRLPVLVMTARTAVEDRVLGLNSGADDYLSKPFDVEELVARLKALVRRSLGVEDFRCGALRLDLDKGRVFRGALPLEMPGRELALLKALMLHPGQAVAKENLHQTVFGDEGQAGSDAIEVLVHRLRKRIQGSGASLVTLRGVGYYLMDDALADKQDAP
ncbi:two-component system, OmpR family, response regulator TctD [Rhodoferax sp. OV413]|uniref:response regulator transcription factor n=1 Tax=Rhodoferax sp. OV413 TaxID=1855285 RepID=UPI00088BFB19|nr:response regulator transcription factor [Rhodoferax sp. OV413]SDP91747.1 two-component system, OmpR family, response regulator TctD [Rhodoferax sp. OV413]